ncbi:MAG: hypothetical protein P8M22_07265 [Phycisphaerales bacterium]|nr:hypothetical protein [Phycisphaerales bacterium]
MRHQELTKHMLKEDGGRAVWLLRAQGQPPLTYKSWTLTPWFACKCLMGIAQPWRHARGAGRLSRAGIKTPKVRTIRPGWHRNRPVLLLVMPYIEGHTALSQLQANDDSQASLLAEQLGLIVATLANAGFRHRDFKLSNVVVEQGSDHPWLIDPVGVVRDRDRVAALAMMLDRLDVEVREGHAGTVPDAARLRRIMLRSALSRSPQMLRRAVLQRLRRHPRS